MRREFYLCDAPRWPATETGSSSIIAEADVTETRNRPTVRPRWPATRIARLSHGRLRDRVPSLNCCRRLEKGTRGGGWWSCGPEIERSISIRWRIKIVSAERQRPCPPQWKCLVGLKPRTDMKCTAIKLTNRKEYQAKSTGDYLKSDINDVYTTKGYHGYSYKLTRIKPTSPKNPTNSQLSITTLTIPEDLSPKPENQPKRWTQKTPRLTKGKDAKTTKNIFDEDYSISYRIDDLLDTSNEEEKNVDEYFVSSDIEELMLKSSRSDESDDRSIRVKMKKKKDEGSKKSGKGKVKKTIRFSLSKAPSPETEQIIRVDVTSTVSYESSSESSRELSPLASCLKTKRFREGKDLDTETEDFIVKCRQLALTRKKK
ncbi:uncharacterized protein LOC143202658 [Rhynchophorus ferrugineus]|uniref:uncharacterized protein LOC143202658 n=1 Tax=Rhynchophorus ferrugineus TaxID=354439 RepID=UPI003FCE4F88